VDSLMRAISDSEEQQQKRGWRAEVNGQLLERVNMIVLENPRFGRLTYGLTPGGWDGWSFSEIGGGGAVTVPFCQFGANLLVGVLEQNRPNQGGMVLNVPRGFLEPGEKHFEAAIREASEELGMSDAQIGERIFRLDGRPMNPNSAFFETIGDDTGVKFYAFKVCEGEILKEGDNYTLNPTVLKAVSKAAQGMMKCRFIYWQEAVQLGDMFTVAAVARLLAR